MTRSLQTSPQHVVPVVTAVDEAFALPLAVTIRSALKQLAPERKLQLHVLDGGLSDESKERLIRSWDMGKIDVHWIEPDIAPLADFDVSQHVSPVAYYRILMPLALPASVKRAIYLDGDLLIRADLGRLWDESQGDAACLAIADTGAPYIDSSLALSSFEQCFRYLATARPIKNYRELGISPAAKYFNSGVLVVDLAQWRREGLAEQMLRCLREQREHVQWWDQYALNVVLAGKWRALDPRWNQGERAYTFPTWQESPFDDRTFQDLRRDPWIVHFTGPRKPWHYFCRHPFRREFFAELDQTAWRGWRPALPKQNLWKEAWSHWEIPVAGWLRVYRERARRFIKSRKRAA